MTDENSKLIENLKEKVFEKLTAALGLLLSDATDLSIMRNVQDHMMLYAQICLMEKADKSPMAAIELAKQHRLRANLSASESLSDLVVQLDQVHLNIEDMDVLRTKLTFKPRLSGALTEDQIKADMFDGKITLFEAQQYFKMIQLQKDGGIFDGTIRMLPMTHELTEDI